MFKQPAERLAEGAALHKAGREAEAEAAYRDILRGDPRNADALLMLGAIRSRHGDLADAARLIGQSLAVNPDQPLAHNNHGVALQGLRRHKDALASYDQALALKPDFADAHNNRGNALRSLRRHGEALESYARATLLKPDFAQAYYNLGLIQQELLRHDEALASFERATALNPDYSDAHWSKGFIKLLTGDFAAGWPLYEYRWKRADYLAPRRDFPQPAWRGGDLGGKTILLYGEQGLGDTIHFCRYAKLVAARGGKVILEVQPALKSLMTSLAGVQQVVAQGEDLPPFDCHCPLLSLPYAFKTELNTIPADVPYLKAQEDLIRRWASILGERRAPRVGLAWAGNPGHRNDSNRSTILLELLPLARSGVELVSLQKQICMADRAALAAAPVRDLGTKFTDFSDTAAAVSLMDIVISVDTSVAHLAGALAKPVWVLLPYAPEWRWLLDRNDSPWYPTAHLFRQPAMGDWRSVVDAIGRELKNLPDGAS